jgi:protein subunit release factor A
MKIIFVMLVLISFLHSDEMQRIEAIVKNIDELRSDYEECQSELISKNATTVFANPTKYKKLYKVERQKNIILKAELDYNKNLQQSNENLTTRVKKLEKLIKSQEDLLKSKTDAFTDLMMKKEYQKKSSTIEKIVKFKATTFYLEKDSNIYNMIDGKKIDKWDKKRTFTSNQKTQNWIKITGYFIDEKWQPNNKEMWIKIVNISEKIINIKML